MKNVVVIGSSNTDLVVRAPRIPKPGETLLGDDFLVVPGGKGANQAVAAARLGAKVTFVGKTGFDGFGQAAKENLEKEHIDVQFFTKHPQKPSGVALITVDDKAENAIVVASGANLGLSKEDVLQAKEAIEKAEVVLLQLESPLDVVRFSIEYVSKSFPEKTLILNPAPAPALALEDSFFKGVSVITPNETEASMLTGISVVDLDSAKNACDVLHQKGVNTVILTMGEKGALVSLQKEGEAKSFQELISAPKVNAIDTTAAGDVFSGALACALAGHEPAARTKDTVLFDAAHFACKAAALSVTRRGAQTSIPYAREI